MSLGDRLREARKHAGYTQKYLAHHIGAKHNSVSNWENGLNMPDPVTIEAICRVLNITPNYLLIGDELGSADSGGEKLNFAEMDLVRKYRNLGKDARGAIDALLGYFDGIAVSSRSFTLNNNEVFNLDAGLAISDAHSFEIIQGKVSLQSVAAGTGTYLDRDNFETIYLKKNNLTKRAAFYVPVSGNSMEPEFFDGDILIVEDTPVKHGEIGVFTLDGHGYVKILGESELISLNKDYAPIQLNDEVTCNGKVIGTVKPDWLLTGSGMSEQAH